MKILFKKLKNLFFKKSTKNLSAFVIKIASKMIKDWTHSPYQDKIRIESQNKKIYYKCEDDSEIIIDYLNSKLEEFNNNFVTFSNITDREENYIIELISDFLTTAKIRTKSYEEQIKDEFEKNFSDYDSHRNQSNNRNNRNNRNYSKYCSREHMNLAHKFTASTKMDIKPSYKPVNYELYEQWKVWKNSNKKITQKKQDIFKILGVKRIC